jgi:hypothetical protein
MTRMTKGEVSAMEARMASLIVVLRESGDKGHVNLAGHLWRCAEQRRERRAGIRDRVDRPCV